MKRQDFLCWWWILLCYRGLLPGLMIGLGVVIGGCPDFSITKHEEHALNPSRGGGAVISFPLPTDQINFNAAFNDMVRGFRCRSPYPPPGLEIKRGSDNGHVVDWGWCLVFTIIQVARLLS